MRLIQSIALILLNTSAIQAQRLVKLNLLEKSPLANMVVYSMNDSTANYTKLVAGTGIQITYNENDTTLTITATGTSVGVPQTLSLNDGTRVLSISDGNSVDLSESIQEEVNAMLVAGDNVTLTYNDVANTLTIASTGGGGGATNIGDLGDVTITSATTGQVLKYDGAAWINGVDLNTETLSALTDVDTTGKTDGSIILYNSTSGNWEAQANSIDNLTDAEANYTYGSIYIGNSNVDLGASSNYNDTESTFLGINAGPANPVYANTGVGINVLKVADLGLANSNTGVGANALVSLRRSSSNVAIGRNAMRTDTSSFATTALGMETGIHDITYVTGPTTSSRSIYVGFRAKPLNQISTSEIVIGAETTGHGDSTVTIGKSSYKGTYLNGNLNLNGYGLGNKEAADIGKTASAYIAGYATDGTLIELPSSGLGISLTDLSVTQNSPGTAGLTYNNTNGVFTYTPPDLSSYLTSEVDGSVTNEIQDLSLTGNTLSLSGDATTVDLSTYLDDQTVVLTQGGIVSISGTYPNFTISATEVDGSVTNEIQDLSLTGNTLSLSGDATTVDLSTYLDDQTVVLTQGGIVSISGTYPNFTISATEVDGSVTNEIQDLSLTGNVLSLSGDATTVDLTESVQDEINNTITAGEGISVVYDDGAGTLTISAPSGAGNTDEQTLSINNATAELSISNGNTVDLSEAIDNQVNTLTVAGTNIAKVYDDGANTLTLSTTDALTAIDAITFDANTTTEVANRLQFNTEYNTLTFGMANATPIRIGQDLGWLVKNQTGTTIAKGVAVMAVGTVGASGRILIDELVADGSVDAHYFLGVTAETIADGADGFVTSQGHIRGINTSAFTAGAVLYASPTTPGAFTATEPTGNDLKLPLAFVLNSDPTNGEIAVRADPGASIKDLHDVDVTGITDNSILKYNNTSGTWEIGTDLEESTTAANGLTLSGTDVKLGGTLSDATTTIDMNSNGLTFTNNGGYNLSGTGGLSFTNTSATDYSSVLSIAATNTRIYADGGTTEPLNSLNLTSARSGVKELDLRSSVSNDNTTYTMIALNPTRFSMKTPNVTDLTATNGQFLKLVDRLTGEVEFADALTSEVDGSVTNEIQDLSLTGNTLSLSSDATTVDLSPYLDDQTVTLTGGGITAISGSYPNFTITSTEVDGSVTNEIQDLSLSGNTLSLSGDATTVDLSTYLDESTTASNGLTLSGTNVKLGGALTETTSISINNNNLNIGTPGIDITYIKLQEATGDIFTQGDFYFKNSSGFSYGSGNSQAGSFGVTQSPYIAGFATNGAFIEVPISSLGSGSVTASNGLTKSGDDIKLGGTLTEITNIAMGGFNASIFDVTSSTGLAIQPSINEVIMYGTQSFTDYGSGNKEAGDLSKTFSGHYAGFATDGTVIEVNALPITSGTSATIDWGNMPQRIHVLDFGANTSLTLSFSNVAVGGIYTLRVTGNSGTDTLVWPAAAKFEDGTSTGTVTLQDGGQMFTFYYDGTNYWVK